MNQEVRAEYILKIINDAEEREPRKDETEWYIEQSRLFGERAYQILTGELTVEEGLHTIANSPYEIYFSPQYEIVRTFNDPYTYLRMLQDSLEAGDERALQATMGRDFKEISSLIDSLVILTETTRGFGVAAILDGQYTLGLEATKMANRHQTGSLLSDSWVLHKIHNATKEKPHTRSGIAFFLAEETIFG